MYFSVTRRVPLMEQELLTIREHLSSPFFSGVHVTRSIVFCVMFCRSLFVLLSFFFFSLCRLFFDLRIMIIPLVSSKSFYISIFLDSIAMQFTFICSGTYAIHLAFLCSRINGGMNGCYILRSRIRFLGQLYNAYIYFNTLFIFIKTRTR